ncbi:MAG: hypothetical protein ABSC89_13255 [Verrucomicrobiota bacterium]|jgi:hypothetical protein
MKISDIAGRNQHSNIVETLLRASKGYASLRDWPDKKSKERGIVYDLLKSIKAEGGHHDILHVRTNKPDPPDCVGTVANGELVAFEVTELVDQKTVERNRLGQRAQKRWTPNELVAKVQEIIQGKDSKQFHGGPYSKVVLVIHTDEPRLRRFDDCKAILHNQKLGRCKQITDAYLLGSFVPRRKFYPFLRLQISGLLDRR